MKRSALVPMLLYAQDEIGYVTDAVIAEIADRMGLTTLEVRNVASYYSMLRFKPAGKFNMQVCTNISCMLRGGYDVLERFQQELGSREQGRHAGRSVLARRGGVHRSVLLGAGHPGELRLSRRADAGSRAGDPFGISRASQGGHLMPRLVSHPDEVKIVSQRFGQGAAKIDRYIELGGYEAAKKCLAQGPDWIINEMKASNLRGRGGAGFPTGLKWSLRAQAKSRKPKYVLVNGDESEPGTCKDHLIFLHDPHAVIEGTIIAGLAIGAKLGFIYLRGEYRYLLEIMEKAVADAYAKGFLGKNIFGVGIRVPDHYADRRGRVRSGRRVGADGVARGQAGHSAHQAALPCRGRTVRRADGDQQRRDDCDRCRM